MSYKEMKLVRDNEAIILEISPDANAAFILASLWNGPLIAIETATISFEIYSTGINRQYSTDSLFEDIKIDPSSEESG